MESPVTEWFFTSDLHGQNALYEQVVALVAAHRPRALVIGGDLCPHAVDHDGPARQRVFLEGFLVEFARRIRDASRDTELLLLMGNDDWKANHDCLEARDGDLWRVLHGRALSVAGVRVAGLSWVPITPFGLKDWERWDDGGEEQPVRLDGFVSGESGIVPHRFDPGHRLPTIAAALQALEQEARLAECILVSHSPPSETHCDLTTHGRHVGSRALRRCLETHQPRLVLCGHIHESPRVSSSYRDTIGRTIVVNPGQFGTSRLCGVWFDPDDVAVTLRHSIYG
jgi:Icc-related predicted phosphoesterase